jgi:hypothetical protein
MKNDIKKILHEVSCASSEGEISIGVNKIENLYAPIIKSLKESNDLVYNLQQELLKNSNELLEIKETANNNNKIEDNKKAELNNKMADEYAMKFHNWCNKLTAEKNQNCFVKITNLVYQIKPTGALLNIFKKEVYKLK